MTTRRKVPKLTPEQIALHAGISKNARLFSLDAAVALYADHLERTTTPFERTRALIETKSFLLKLVDTKRQPPVPKSVREHAKQLLQHYPAYVDIEAAHKALPELYASVYPPGLLDDPLRP